MTDLNSTYGALFIGLLASAVLFGVTMLQAFVYFSQYPADRVWRKLAVCWLCFLDALHLALCAHFVYFYLVINYDDSSALLHIVWSFKVRTVIDGLVVVSVHTLYTLRLWTLLAIDNHVKPFGKEDRRWSDQKLTKSAGASRWLMCRLVPWFVSALLVIGYGISIVMCYETFRLDSFDRLSHAPWATYVPFCFSTVIDTFIAGSLCYFLSRCRTESGAMNGPIRTLMVYTLNTGIISSVCSLIAISMMVAYPNTFISVAIEFLVIKLYINSYLAMVNARGGLRNEPSPRLNAAYTSNTSIALRDVVQVEHKPIPFLTYPHFNSSLHVDRQPLDSAQKSVEVLPSHDIVLNLPEPYLMRAPRISHPDVCKVTEQSVTGQPYTIATSVAETLDITPPAHRELTDLASPSTDDEEDVSLPPSPISPSSPSSLPPLSPSRASPYPFHFSHSHPLSVMPPSSYPQDYPSPPERSLSPLRFASSEVGLGIDDEDPMPMVYAAPRDKYTRMVRSARSKGKARRALFDERGVALMWGLPHEA
ncbi:hypothetical protein L227DRAFT_392609 [Lentinus tigrinus ALCF2SS1-6]|uniref:DUF6534 domain-containing protein n=1 Tax=Lentinus tigrinus ALCF2SS1-6 TaxID=1328759 RepID=A0A5C2SJQ8_9APHY|nr:hypothetical protein L227DRAFT_392609 [Lentinus tigrinus ALCF2SS1-6]